MEESASSVPVPLLCLTSKICAEHYCVVGQQRGWLPWDWHGLMCLKAHFRSYQPGGGFAAQQRAGLCVCLKSLDCQGQLPNDRGTLPLCLSQSPYDQQACVQAHAYQQGFPTCLLALLAVLS